MDGQKNSLKFCLLLSSIDEVKRYGYVHVVVIVQMGCCSKCLDFLYSQFVILLFHLLVTRDCNATLGAFLALFHKAVSPRRHHVIPNFTIVTHIFFFILTLPHAIANYNSPLRCGSTNEAIGPVRLLSTSPISSPIQCGSSPPRRALRPRPCHLWRSSPSLLRSSIDQNDNRYGQVMSGSNVPVPTRMDLRLLI